MNAKQAEAIIKIMAADIEAHKDELTELDAAIGDADHGVNMARGFGRALEKMGIARYELPTEVFKDVAMMLMSAVGGSAGPLYGNFFVKMAMRFRGEANISPELFGSAFSDGVSGVMALGKGARGDKTMLDALIPACEAYNAAVKSGGDIKSGLEAALQAARDGAEATIPMIAHKGRASYLGERSIGHKDPGAASSVIIVEAMLKGASA